MIRNHLLWCTFSIVTCFLTSTVAREAVVNGMRSFSVVYSYQVSVQLHRTGHVCGGGIVGDRFIVTAAHCVLNNNRELRSKKIFVLAGTDNLNKTGPPALTVLVEKVFFPKEYHPMVAFNFGDIAVLKLISSLQVGTYESLVKLELPRSEYHGESKDLFIAGFGWNEYPSVHKEKLGSNDGHLYDATVEVLSSNDCENSFPPGAIYSDIHLCARVKYDREFIRGTQYGTCNGDGGGPLVESGTVLIGILSKISANCDEDREPAIYMRASHYAPMIYNIMHRGRDPHVISLQL